MSAEECIILPARLSRRLAIEINLTRTGHMHVEWDPAVPKRLTRKEHRAYLRARDEAASRLADLVGGAVLVVTL